MQTDTSFCAYLSDLVLICDHAGAIRYANPAAQRWSKLSPDGLRFPQILSPQAAAKSERFLEAARDAGPAAPTAPWELPLGDSDDYTIARFRGYVNSSDLVIIGEIEPASVTQMQREMLTLTSELSEAQREQRRQNRQLQQALAEQRRLFETISEMTAPALPIWDRVLLLPLVGHIDSQRAELITSQLLQRVAGEHAVYAILDVSGIGVVDTAVAQQLIHTAQALRLLGVEPILVGINPEIAQTIVNLGVHLSGFVVQADLHSAMRYVLRRLGQFLRP